MFKRLGNFFKDKASSLGSFLWWVVTDEITAKKKIEDEAAETADEIKKVLEIR